MLRHVVMFKWKDAAREDEHRAGAQYHLPPSDGCLD